MSSRAQQRRHTRAGLGAEKPPSATRQQSERDVALDSLADFVSEETLPPHPPRKNDDDAALDAFEHETSSFAEPSVPTWTSTAAASPAPNARRDGRTFVLPAWRAIAAAVGIAAVTILGLLVRQTGNPLGPVDSTRGSTVASAPENRPAVLRPTAASPGVRPAAPPVDAPPAQGRPLPEAPTRAQVDPTGAQVERTGDPLASDPGVVVEAGVGQVLLLPGPVPEIPPATMPTPLTNGTDSGGRSDASPPVAASEPALSSAQDQVGALLGQYQAAYSRLDAELVQAIWPSVDRPRLERAFRNLKGQDLEFDDCRLNIASATAVATCTGVVEYTTRVGNRNARDARSWTFTLRKASESWHIQAVLMR